MASDDEEPRFHLSGETISPTLSSSSIEALRQAHHEVERRVRATLDGAVRGATVDQVFRSDLPMHERYATACHLRGTLQQRVLELRQEATAKGITVPAAESFCSNPSLVRALRAVVTSAFPSVAARLHSKLVVATTEESEAARQLDAAVARLTSSSAAVRKELVQPKVQHRSIITKVSQPITISVPPPRPPADSWIPGMPGDAMLRSTPRSRFEMVRQAAAAGAPLCAHWFWCAKLRVQQMLSLTVRATVTRQGIALRGVDGGPRSTPPPQDLISLGNVELISLGFTADAFRWWCEWIDAQQRKGDEAEVGATTATFDGARYTHRSVSVKLRAPQRSSLSGMWFQEANLIFADMDTLNAFLAAALHWIASVQWGKEALAFIVPPTTVPPAFLQLVSQSYACGELDPDEADFCRTWLVHPRDVVRVKQLVFQRHAPPLLTLEAMFDIAPSLHIVQVLHLWNLFESQSKVALTTIYVAL